MEDMALAVIVKRAVQVTVTHFGIKGAAASLAGPAGWVLVADGAVNAILTIKGMWSIHDAANTAQDIYCNCENVVE
jgi:hypothetical protein